MSKHPAKKLTTDRDHIFIDVTVNDKIIQTTVVGKQIVLFDMLRYSCENNKLTNVNRIILRDKIDEFLINSRKKNKGTYPKFSIPVFKNRGEFSNALETMINKGVIVISNLYSVTLRNQMYFDIELNPFEETDNLTLEESRKIREEAQQEKHRKYQEEYAKRKREQRRLEAIKKQTSPKPVITKTKSENKSKPENKPKKNVTIKSIVKYLEDSKTISKPKSETKPETKEIKKEIQESKPVTSLKPLSIIGASQCIVNKPKDESVSINHKNPTVSKGDYKSIVIDKKYKENYEFEHGVYDVVRHPRNRAALENKRVIKRKHYSKLKAKNRQDTQIVSPLELQSMMADFLESGNKIKVYSQVSKDIKEIIKGPDRKYVLELENKNK